MTGVVQILNLSRLAIQLQRSQRCGRCSEGLIVNLQSSTLAQHQLVDFLRPARISRLIVQAGHQTGSHIQLSNVSIALDDERATLLIHRLRSQLRAGGHFKGAGGNGHLLSRQITGGGKSIALGKNSARYLQITGKSQVNTGTDAHVRSLNAFGHLHRGAGVELHAVAIGEGHAVIRHLRGIIPVVLRLVPDAVLATNPDKRVGQHRTKGKGSTVRGEIQRPVAQGAEHGPIHHDAVLHVQPVRSRSTGRGQVKNGVLDIVRGQGAKVDVGALVHRKASAEHQTSIGRESGSRNIQHSTAVQRHRGYRAQRIQAGNIQPESASIHRHSPRTQGLGITGIQRATVQSSATAVGIGRQQRDGLAAHFQRQGTLCAIRQEGLHHTLPAYCQRAGARHTALQVGGFVAHEHRHRSARGHIRHQRGLILHIQRTTIGQMHIRSTQVGAAANHQGTRLRGRNLAVATMGPASKHENTLLDHIIVQNGL